MKSTCIALAFLCISLVQAEHLLAQPRFNDVILLFDANWNQADDLSRASYFMQVVQYGDTVFKCRYYRVSGPMVKEETYNSAELNFPSGRFCWYDEKGNLDSTGFVYDGKKDGSWLYYDDNLKHQITEEYAAGRRMEQRDFVRNTYTDDKGNVQDLQEKIMADREAFVADSIAGKLRVEEAGFKGGMKGWTNYISRNVSTPDRMTKTLPPGYYTVKICFLVNKQGAAEDLFLTKSVEWSADLEVFRIIQESPAWKPATRNGKPVLFRQLQNITFQVSP